MLVGPGTATVQPALDVLVLAAGRRSCVGIDLRSGALVRTHEPRSNGDLLRPFDTARATIARTQIDRPEQPEAIAVETPLARTGSMFGWRVDRVLRNVSHPEHKPLFGSASPALPFWTLDGDRPSVSVLAVNSGVSVCVDARGVRCRFPWNNATVDLPLEDTSVLAMLDWLPDSPLHGMRLARAIGFQPKRLVVALSRPFQGYCYKVVAGLLPSP